MINNIKKTIEVEKKGRIQKKVITKIARSIVLLSTLSPSKFLQKRGKYDLNKMLDDTEEDNSAVRQVRMIISKDNYIRI